ncbi:MAG: hypothetical protein WCR49_01795 [Opitutae bacterium]
MMRPAVIARSETTKQSIRFNPPQALCRMWDWIAAPGVAGLAMTNYPSLIVG